MAGLSFHKVNMYKNSGWNNKSPFIAVLFFSLYLSFKILKVMKKRPLRLLIVLFCLFPCIVFAQQKGESKAQKIHNRALALYNAAAYDQALKEVQKAVKADPGFIESWLLLGDISAMKGMRPEAIEAYQKAITIDEGFFPAAYYILGNLQFSEGLYADCLKSYRHYLGLGKAKPAELAKAEKNIKTAEFRIHALANPVPFEPVNLGYGINTEGYEFVNYITADGEQLYFTRRMPASVRNDEEFFVSRLQAGSVWGVARELGPPVNTEGDEGAICISADGQYLFFAACNRPDGYGSCDLYYSRREGGRWSEPRNLGPVVNSSHWESQPSLAPDGRTLYFVSNRPGGWGGSDIWISELQPDGYWGMPANAGPVINTPADERGPFIHPDGQTLYFSSKGHTGMGEGDIFMSRLSANGEWSEPVNIGYPVNSAADEVNLVVDRQGRYAYISSDMAGGFGKQDIYRFELPRPVMPLPVTYMKGVVSDSISGKRLAAAFTLTDLETGKEVVNSLSDAVSGEFLVSIPAGKKYALTAEKPGYLFYSAHIFVEGEAEAEKPYLHDVLLKPVQKDEVTVLRNVFFETDSARLLPESLVELDRLLQFMNRNPYVSIEISGHTDNTGSDAHNIDLSRRRAEAVYDYLAGGRITKGRMTYKGYGAAKPVAGNETPEGRAANRRTEFRITSVGK